MTRQHTPDVPARLRPRFDEIVALTDAIAGEHLTPEYAQLARRMAATLARMGASPLEQWEARTWAATILYAVGWVNFLSDPAQDPHMTAAELARKAGVGASTISLRFRTVRETLDLVRLDPEWTLPSKLPDHPFAWTLLVDGIPVDIRREPREVQEEALRLGLIPFIPADGPQGREAAGGEAAEAAAGQASGRAAVPLGMGDRGGEAGDVARVFQLKITLQDVRPPVWRRVLVPEDTTLVGLHRVIQAAMGWEDYHLWKFELGEEVYSADLEDSWGEPLGDARHTRLNEVAAAGDVLQYEYDFGDSWEHRVRVEKVLPAVPGRTYPVCLAAERACPPEDCGGVWGYEHLLEVLADPADPEHDEMLEWVGGEFDPERVDPDEINRHLALTRPRASDGGWEGEEEEGEAESLLALHHLAEAAVGEIGDLLRRLVAENPDATFEEAEAVLQDASRTYNARPQPELGGLSPEQMHRLLYGDPEWEGRVVRVDSSLTLPELEGSRTLHNARLFLALLGESGEVKATPAGNLPRAFVAGLREGFRRPAWYVDDHGAERKVVNEEDDSLVHLTRILLDVAGLIKRRKGAFSLTRAGARLLEERRAGELFATLFRVHFRRLNLELMDGVGPVPGFQHTIAFPLFRFGQVGEAWRTRVELKGDLVLPAVRREVRAEETWDPMDIVLESRLLRPLEGFGLAEAERLPREPRSWRDVFRYRKAPRFDRLLRFDL